MQDRGDEERPKPKVKTAANAGLGATEEQVTMSHTVAQRVNREGTKLEDLAGTGDHHAKGG